jgi:hypothetical protein
VLVTANLGKPDITTSNTFQDCFFDFSGSVFPVEVGEVDTTLSPGDFTSGGVDEFKDVRVGEVKVKHDGSVLVDPASTELLVKAAIDFAKRHWA